MLPADSTSASKPSATLFDLPTELRFQIYNHLFPNRKFLSWGGPIAFFRTNRQICEEASDAFYGSGSFAIAVYGCYKSHPTGYVNFLAQTVDLDDIPNAAVFGLLRRIKRLRLRICANTTEWAVCEARDVLTALLCRLGDETRLELLEVTVDINRHAKNVESIKPQEISPTLLLAFMTAPLRSLRPTPGTRLEVSSAGMRASCYLI